MNRRLIIYSILVSLVLTLLSILFFDQPIAAFVQGADGRSSAILLKGTSFLEVISGFPIGKYALTCALLAAGLVLLAWKSTRSAAWMLLFVWLHAMHNTFSSRTLKEYSRDCAFRSY